jgi:hypothetical protein
MDAARTAATEQLASSIASLTSSTQQLEGQVEQQTAADTAAAAGWDAGLGKVRDHMQSELSYGEEHCRRPSCVVTMHVIRSCQTPCSSVSLLACLEKWCCGGLYKALLVYNSKNWACGKELT